MYLYGPKNRCTSLHCSWYFHEPLMKMWMSSTPTAIPTRVHGIWSGHNIPANAYKHYNTIMLSHLLTQ